MRLFYGSSNIYTIVVLDCHWICIEIQVTSVWQPCPRPCFHSIVRDLISFECINVNSLNRLSHTSTFISSTCSYQIFLLHTFVINSFCWCSSLQCPIRKLGGQQINRQTLKYDILCHKLLFSKGKIQTF